MRPLNADDSRNSLIVVPRDENVECHENDDQCRRPSHQQQQPSPIEGRTAGRGFGLHHRFRHRNREFRPHRRSNPGRHLGRNFVRDVIVQSRHQVTILINVKMLRGVNDGRVAVTLLFLVTFRVCHYFVS